MRKLSFFLLFLTLFASAQNQRFIYEYKYVPDSTEMSTVETEIMNLDIALKGSKFYSSTEQAADSTMTEMQKKPNGKMDFTKIKFGKVKEVVEKMYPNFNIFLFQRLDVDAYKVEDDREIIWKILPKKEKIGNWETQKASTKMYGRNWTAWFTTSLPFQDGPYKFHGLPGLIVKISDSNQTHIFELKAVKNLNKDEEWKSFDQKNLFQKPIPLQQERFKNVYLKFRKDPAAGMRQMVDQSGNQIKMIDASGKVMDIKKALIDQEKMMKEGFKKNNNLLELDLLR
jgi:GLPGLI family protein